VYYFLSRKCAKGKLVIDGPLGQLLAISGS
jgi:hypothetical protein